jgi:hypothetical protein
MKTEIMRTNTPPAELVRVPAGTIERRIFAMRGHTVMLDRSREVVRRDYESVQSSGQAQH